MKAFFSAAFEIACFCLGFCFGGWFIALILGMPNEAQSSFSGWGLLVGFIVGLIWFFVVKAKDKARTNTLNSFTGLLLLMTPAVDYTPLAVLFTVIFVLFLMTRFFKPGPVQEEKQRPQW